MSKFCKCRESYDNAPAAERPGADVTVAPAVLIRTQLRETPPSNPALPRGTQQHPQPHPAGPIQHSQRSGGAYLLRFLTEQEALVKPELREDTADKGNGASVGGTVVQPPALQQLGLPSHVLREGIVAQPVGGRVGVSPSRGDQLQSTARDLPCTPAPTWAVLHRKLGWGAQPEEQGVLQEARSE